MEETFIFKANRKRLFIFLAVVTGACIVVRIILYATSDNNQKNINDHLLGPLFDNLAATYIVSLSVALVYLFRKGEEEQMVTLTPERIGPELRISREQTQHWVFSGGTGTDTRHSTMPHFGGLPEKKSRSITIQVIDPQNKQLCALYAAFRNKSQRKWTERSVQLKVYATILSAIYWHQNAHLRIEVHLKNNFSALRYDISDSRIIITTENPESDAYLIKNSHSFYYAIQNEIDVRSDVSRKIKLDNCKTLHTDIFDPSFKVTSQFMQDTFEDIGVKFECTQEEAELILNDAKPKKNL